MYGQHLRRGDADKAAPSAAVRQDVYKRQNQEWSTELTVPQAMDEYIKAWCALKVLSKVYGFGDPNGFVFNMPIKLKLILP